MPGASADQDSLAEEGVAESRTDGGFTEPDPKIHAGKIVAGNGHEWFSVESQGRYLFPARR